MKFKDIGQLRQALLELHYDLLEEDEARALRAAIAHDPEVAAEWASTLQLAEQLADAATFEDAALTGIAVEDLRRSAESSAVEVPGSNGRVTPNAANASTLIQPPHADSDDFESPPVVRASARGWWFGSLGLAATAAVVGMMILGSAYQQRVPDPPNALVRVQAEPIPAHSSLSSNEFRIRTTRMDGTTTSAGRLPITPATLSFSVLARNTVLYSGQTETDGGGSGRIALPARLVIPRDAKLRVIANTLEGDSTQSTLEVPLEPTRCLTYLVVDRPVYRPGETVYFRSLTLQRRSLVVNADVPIRFELVDPSGAVVPGATNEGVTERGVGNGSLVIPSSAAGGTYTLVARSLDDFFPEERCEFQVRAYRVPRFKKELEFRRRSFGPGDRVEADLKVQRAEGGPLSGAAILATATVDGKVIHRSSATTSADGECFITFDLPELMDEGSGQLSVAIDDGGTRETKTETIPIQSGRVSVDFYPEGGYLVDGLDTRVYFTARDSVGNPIHLEGEIQNQGGDMIARIATVRDGMGRFEFEPVRGQRYSLKVTSPVDVTTTPTLPSVVKSLPVINTGDGVFDWTHPIRFSVSTTDPMKVVIHAVCRGELVGEKEIQLDVGENIVSLPVNDDVGGVVRVTVSDASVVPAQPLVERLVYRRYRKRLDVQIVDDLAALQRTPGEPLRLTLQVRDEQGDPTAAVLGVSVVDDAALSLDHVERPGLATHFLLTSEIETPEDLEHADFYLRDGDSEAAHSLDLLLGTQGWRRFISASSVEPGLGFREQLVRLLELDGADDGGVATPFDNADQYSGRWLAYRTTVVQAWQQMVQQAKALMLVILGTWLLSLILHLRRGARASAAMLLLFVSTTVLIYGCGQSSLNTVAVSDEERYEVDMARATGDLDGAAAMSATAEKKEEPKPMVAAVPQSAQVLPSESERSQETFSVEADDERVATLVTREVANETKSISKADLQRLLAARGLDAPALADQLLRELRFPIRQYAHRYRSSDTGVRRDFAETLYWQPLLVTDSEGRATIRFDLSDSVTTFRVNVDGHSMNGRIGSGSGVVASRLPFQIEPKLPLAVSAGDRIDMPIAVINATDTETRVELSTAVAGSLQINGQSKRTVRLDGGQRQREYVSINVTAGSSEQQATVQVNGVGERSLADAVQRSLFVSPAGYPHRDSIAGKISERAVVALPIPDGLVEGSLSVTVRGYPSPIADVMSGVESMLREPHGCFEQTSATNYPNTMAMLYLRNSESANPDFERRALGMLERGYQKLLSFECEQRGYDWFGVDPGHEALSAFGLMQFTDMSRVIGVSQQMIDRTRTWLMGRRDGKGGFNRNPRHLHAWSVQQSVVNAYVLWAITEADVAAGQPQRAAADLAQELDQLHRVADRSNDPYLVALSAAALINAGRGESGEALLQRMANMQNNDGSLQGKTTVTSSGGLSLKMETTALGTIAWLKSPKFIDRARASAAWISRNRLGNSGFGSTQATVLALKALTSIANHTQSQHGGSLIVSCNGIEIGRASIPSSRTSGSIVEITNLGARLESLRDSDAPVSIELLAPGTRNLSYTIDIASHVNTPQSDNSCPVQLETKLTGEFDQDAVVTAGTLIKVQARLTNVTQKGQPMTVAIVGLPGGVQPRAEELDELQQSGAFDYYELRPREVILYWRTIEPEAVKRFDFHVTAVVPGQYTGPASRAYLYYTAEQKQWVQPMAVTIGR